MANTSEAVGYIAIRKSIYMDLKDILEEYTSCFKASTYGVAYWGLLPEDILEEYDARDMVPIQVIGAGRWMFKDCLEDLDWFFLVEDNPLGKYLIDYFTKLGGEEIHCEFADYEPLMEVLYKATGKSYVDQDGVLRFALVIEDIKCTSRNVHDLFVEMLTYDNGAFGSTMEAFVERFEERQGRPLTGPEMTRVSEWFNDEVHDGFLLPEEQAVLLYELERL